MNVTPETPWLGLRSFTEEVEDYFYGRTRELDDLFERVQHRTLTVLFGQSGLGKTSLLRAGLIPQLKKAGYSPVLIRLHYEEDAPPLEQQVIAGLLSIAPILGVSPDSGVSLWELFHDPRFGFLSPGSPRPVLMFDQFEEIFTLGRAEERRADALAFRDALTALVENRPPPALRARMEEDDELADRYDFPARPCKVLLSLREDFLHLLERWRSHMPSLMDNRLELRLLNGEQALSAVVEPGAKRAGKPPIVSAETGEAIVRFVAGVGPEVPMKQIDAVPPLLSLICAELNAQRFAADGSVLQTSIEPSQLQGRSEDILQRYYNDCFSPHPTALRHFVEDRLLSADGTVRESATEETALREMQKAGINHGEAEKSIEALLNQRLLVAEERGGARRLELTHDVLTGVARLSRDQRYEREREAKAQELAAAAQRQRNRLLRLVAAFGLLAATSVVAAALAFNAWRQAKADRERAVAAEESAIKQKGIAEANQLLAEESLQRVKRREFDELVAKRRYPEAQATLSLAASMGEVKDREWLQMSLPKPLFKHLGRTSPPAPKPVKTMLTSPGGRFVAMLLNDGELRMLDEHTRQIVSLNSISTEGEIRWGNPNGLPPGPERQFRAITFPPSGEYNPFHLVAVTQSDHLIVMDLEQNKVLSTQPVQLSEITGNKPVNPASKNEAAQSGARPADNEGDARAVEANQTTAAPPSSAPVTALAFAPSGQILYGMAGRQLLSWAGPDLQPRKPLQTTLADEQTVIQSLVVGLEWLGFTTATQFGVISPLNGRTVTTSVGAPMSQRPLLAMPRSDQFMCESFEPGAGCMSYSKNQSGFDQNLYALDSELRSLALHPDGRLVVGGCADGSLAVIEGSARGSQVMQAQADAITACAFRADGRLLYTSSTSGEIGVWEVSELSHQELALRSMGDHELSGTLGSGGTVTIAADFGLLVSDETSVTLKRALDFDFTQRISFSQDGTLLAGYRFVNSKEESGGWVTVLETHTGKVLLETPGEPPLRNQSYIISADNKWFAHLRGSGAVEVHSLTGEKSVFKLPRSRRHLLTCMAFSPEGTTLAVGHEKEAVDFWRFATDGTKVTSTSYFFQGASQLAYQSDGKRLFIGGNSGDLLIWDIAAKQLTQVPTGESTGYSALTALPDNKVACGFLSGKIGVWNTGQSQPLCVLRTAQTDTAASLTFDARSMRLLATFRNSPPQLWSANAGTPALDSILADSGRSAERYEIKLTTAAAALPSLPGFEPVVARFWSEFAALDGRSSQGMKAAWSELGGSAELAAKVPEAAFMALDVYFKSDAPDVKLSAEEQFDLMRFFNLERRFTMRKMRGMVDGVFRKDGPLTVYDSRNAVRRKVFLSLLTHVNELRTAPEGSELKSLLQKQVRMDLAEYYRWDSQDQWEKNLLAGIVSANEVDMIYKASPNAGRLSREARAKVDSATVKAEEQVIRDLVERSLFIDPRDVIAPLALGELEARLGHPDLAEKAYREALAKARIQDPYDSEWITLGIAGYIIEQGVTDERWAQFKELTESALRTVHTRNAFSAHQIAAKHAAKSGKADYAASLYEAAAAFATDGQSAQGIDVYIERARVLLAAGQEEAAISQMKSAIERAGLTSSQLRERGIKAYNDGTGYFDYHLSLAYLNSAIAQDPKDAEALKYRAFNWFNREKYQEAINDYLEAAKVDPENKYHLYNASRSFTFLGRFREAAAVIEKAGLDYGDDVSYWVFRYRAAIRRNLGDMQGAASDIDHAIQLIEDSISKAANETEKKRIQQDLYVYRFERAQIWLRQGRQSDVIAELKTLGQIDPKATVPLLYLAQVMDSADSPRSEVEAAYAAVKPASGWLSDASRARCALGELDDAWKDLVEGLLNGTYDATRLYVPGRWMDYAVYFTHRHRLEQQTVKPDQSTDETSQKAPGHAEAALLCLLQAVKAGFAEGDLLKHDYSFKPLWEDQRFRLLVRALGRDAADPMRHYELAVFTAQLASIIEGFDYDFQGGPVPMMKFAYPTQKDGVTAQQLRKPSPLTAEQREELKKTLVTNGIAFLAASFQQGLGDIKMVIDDPLLAPLRNQLHWGDKIAVGLGQPNYHAVVKACDEGRLDGRVFGSMAAALRPSHEIGWEEHALHPFNQWWSFYESNAMLEQWAVRFRASRKDEPVLLYWSDDVLKVLSQEDYLRSAKITALLSDSTQPVNGYHPGEIQFLFEYQLGRYNGAVRAFQRLRDEPYPEGARSMADIVLFQIARLSLSALYAPEKDGNTKELDTLLSDALLHSDWWQNWGRTNFLAIADTYLSLEQWEKAEAALDFGLKQYPTESLLLEAKGLLLQRRGRDAERVAMLDAALAKVKEDDSTSQSQVLASQAWLHFTAGNIAAAGAAADSVLKMPKAAFAAAGLARLILKQASPADSVYHQNQIIRDAAPSSYIALARVHAQRAVSQPAGSLGEAREFWHAHYMLSRLAGLGWRNLHALVSDPLLKPLFETGERGGEAGFYHQARIPVLLKELFTLPLSHERERMALNAMICSRLLSTANQLRPDEGLRLECAVLALEDARFLLREETPSSSAARLAEDPYYTMLKDARDPLLTAEINSARDVHISLTNTFIQRMMIEVPAAGKVEWPDERADEDLRELSADGEGLHWTNLLTMLADDGAVSWSAASGDPSDRRHATRYYLHARFHVEKRPVGVIFSVARDLTGSPELIGVIADGHPYHDQGARRKLLTLWREFRGDVITKQQDLNRKAAEQASQGNHAEAVALFEKAFDVRPPHTGTLYQYAMSLARTKISRDRAKELLTSISRARAWNPGDLRSCGWSYINLGMPADAEKVLSLADRMAKAADAPVHPELMVALAIAQHLNGKKSEAITTYKRAINASDKWADKTMVEGLAWPEEEKVPLLEIHAAATKPTE